MPNITLAAARRIVAAGPPPSVVEVNVGADYMLARRSDNTSWAWGDALNGGLGNNNSLNRTVCAPVLVVGSYTFCQIAAGYNASAGIRESDKLGFTWGTGVFGAGGRGNSTNTSSPAPVTGGYSYSKITVANHVTTAMGAITVGGTAYTWGINSSGMLGINSLTSQVSPVPVCCNFCYCDIAVGNTFMVALNYLGELWGWGSRVSGRIALPPTPASALTPVAATAAADGNSSYSRISAGNQHGVAISAAGTAYAWGLNTQGQLGDNTTASKNSPVLVCGGLVFCRISAGDTQTFGITTGGTLYGWGFNSLGQLGVGNLSPNLLTPVSVCTTLQFCEVSGGISNSAGLAYDGKVYTWGINRYGTLGIGTLSMVWTPTLLDTTLVASYIGIGIDTVGLISDGGTAFAWGYGLDGALGNNTSLSPGFADTPTQVCGATALLGITMGDDFAITWTSGGTAYAWGGNVNGYLGDNTVTSKSTPVAVCGSGLSFTKISTKSRHTLAITNGGTGYAWGINTNGQLGVLGTTSRRTPTQFHVSGNFSYCDISAGYTHSLAVRDDGGGTGGTGYSWGNNNAGQLGKGDTLSRQTPGVILARKFCRVVGSNQFSLGITNGGTVVAWGLNSSRQLGDNTTTSRTTPVLVCGLTGLAICDIAAGNAHGVALTTGGTAYAWGLNNFGNLGDGTQLQRSMAVAVCHAGINFVSIAAHDNTTMAMTSSGDVYIWGDGVYGQLGNGNGLRNTPVSVNL